MTMINIFSSVSAYLCVIVVSEPSVCICIYVSLRESIFVFQSLLKAKPPITEDDFKEDFQRQVRLGHISDEDDDEEEEEEDDCHHHDLDDDDDDGDDGYDDDNDNRGPRSCRPRRSSRSRCRSQTPRTRFPRPLG